MVVSTSNVCIDELATAIATNAVLSTGAPVMFSQLALYTELPPSNTRCHFFPLDENVNTLSTTVEASTSLKVPPTLYGTPSNISVLNAIIYFYKSPPNTPPSGSAGVGTYKPSDFISATLPTSSDKFKVASIFLFKISDRVIVIAGVSSLELATSCDMPPKLEICTHDPFS